MMRKSGMGERVTISPAILKINKLSLLLKLTNFSFFTKPVHLSSEASVRNLKSEFYFYFFLWNSLGFSSPFRDLVYWEGGATVNLGNQKMAGKQTTYHFYDFAARRLIC